MVVGNGPGGGFDVYARLLAHHISQYLPGHPSVVVQNMPGAGSLVAANYIYNVAPRDGTTFGLIARNLPLIGLLGQNSNVRFDPRKFTWLGSSSDFSHDAYVLIMRKDAPAGTITDALRPGGPPLVLGGTAMCPCRRTEHEDTDTGVCLCRPILASRFVKPAIIGRSLNRRKLGVMESAVSGTLKKQNRMRHADRPTHRECLEVNV